MYIVMKSLYDEQSPKNVYGFTIGGYYSAINIAFGRISGGSMNPARVLGPAVFSGYYRNLWIFMLGPAVGCALGIFLYKAAHMDDNKRLTETTQQPDLVMLKPVEIEVHL